MDTVTFKQRLDEFFNHAQKKVLVIKGKWGVGKTYAWNRYIEKKRDFPEAAISYVSLFGAKSAEDVRHLVFAKARPTGDGKIEKVFNTVRKGYVFGKMTPKMKDYAQASSFIESLLIRNYLVCFDDIERKAQGLALSEIFGLTSVLKTENNCRIVLIFNEDVLEKDDLEQLRRFREKLVDAEFTYAPSIIENANLIFGSYGGEKHPFAYDVFQSLDLRNIRVIQHSFWNLSYFEPLTHGLDFRVKSWFLKNVVALTCFFHEYGNEVDLDTIHQFDMSRFTDKDKPKTRQTVLLEQVRFEDADFDPYIVTYLQHGACDLGMVKSILATLNIREKKNKIALRIQEIRNHYRGNFQHSAHEISAEIDAFFKKHLQELTVNEVVTLCDLLKRVDSSVRGDEWLNSWIEAKIKDCDARMLVGLKHYTSKPELHQAIDAKVATSHKKDPLKSIIFRMREQQGWNPDDEMMLDSYSADEYYQWLTTETDPLLNLSLVWFHKTFNSRGQEPLYKNIGSKLEHALDLIAQRDELSKDRVEMIRRSVFGN